MKIILLLFSTAVSLAAVEVVLRALDPPEFPDVSSPIFFWRQSDELGWSGRPGADGFFASGHCYGHVVLDALGNRRNDAETTFRSDYRNLFFIGDSNTVALEVDGNQTVPALLEEGLRSKGLRVNVLNLGVRGYGTDQSVIKALLQADEYRPDQIIYMYTDNDVFDNNVMRQVYRQFGKGVYIRRGGRFEALNYPVPAYGAGYYGVVVLDPGGRPRLYQGTSEPGALGETTGWIQRSSRLVRRLSEIRGNRVEQKIRDWKQRRADPFEVVNTGGHDAEDVFAALFCGLIDGGRARNEHREYYESQIEYLISRLWEIPSLRKIHVVEFPNEPTLELLARGDASNTEQLFQRMRDEGKLASFVGLSREMHENRLDYGDFSCRGGDHFAAEGHRWIAETLLSRVDFSSPADEGNAPVQGSQ